MTKSPTPGPWPQAVPAPSPAHASNGARSTSFRPIEEALEELRRGRMVVVCDSEERENEGDLMVAAEFATPQAINFMARHARGLICLALPPERCDRLGLAPMVAENQSRFGTAFTVSIEARHGVSTGISAFDRSRTIAVALDPRSTAADLVSPGHMFPLRARAGGVIDRPGQTEAAVDLARLAGLSPAGVLCEVMNDDGTMARVPDLERYCALHGLTMVSIADLIEYRRRRERFVERVVETALPTRFGTVTAIGYRALTVDRDHVALVKGEIRGRDDVLVHVHRACLADDVFGSLASENEASVEEALRRIDVEGAGVVLYLSREDRPTGLVDRLRLHRLRDAGLEDDEARRRTGAALPDSESGAAAEILVDLGARSIRLLAGSADDVVALRTHGIAVSGQVSLPTVQQPHARELLRARSRRPEHLLRAYDLGFMTVEADEATR